MTEQEKMLNGGNGNCRKGLRAFFCNLYSFALKTECPLYDEKDIFFPFPRRSV